jgi:HK97 family phage prohead protease
MLKRAYSLLDIKSIDEESRVMEGIASTPTTDRMNDIVEPMGAEFELPLPLLWQHDAHQPIGHVTAAKPNKNGIPVTFKILKVDEPGKLKDRLDEAWQSIKHKLVRGLSIGFAPIEYAYIKETYGIHFTKWNWLELSAVTIPANAEATILSIKTIDRQLRAASGPEQRRPVVLILPPGVAGKKTDAQPRSPIKLLTNGDDE